MSLDLPKYIKFTWPFITENLNFLDNTALRKAIEKEPKSINYKYKCKIFFVVDTLFQTLRYKEKKVKSCELVNAS